MKFNHNKKRNTAFIYEVLVVELARAAMSNDNVKKDKLVSLLKENFSRGKELKRDLDIYRSFNELESLDGDTIIKIIQEAKRQFTSLNRKKIFIQQTSLINEINRSFGSEVWATFVPNYKKLATINQTLNNTLSPKKQVLIEKKLINLLSQANLGKDLFPNVNNLAMKTFVTRFNEEYNKILNNEQKMLLEKYIMSSNDGDMEFKIHFYQEIDRLKEIISKRINEDRSSAPKKLQKIVDKMNSYNTRVLDRELITEVIRIQSLAEEINQ